MTLVELSNIFNIIAEAMPELNNYHFGFLSDIDINIKNNFNPSPKCQTPYPLALFEPPSGSYDPQRSQSTRIVDLWIVDRQQGDKYGTTCETLVEKMSFIEGIGNSFLRSLKFAKIDGACLKVSLKNAVAGTELDGYQFKDRLVTYKMTFSINSPYDTNCISGLTVSNVGDTDREKEDPNSPLVNEYSMLFDQIDEYIMAPNDSTLSFGDGVTDTPLTFSVWLKVGNLAGNDFTVILNKRGNTIGTDEYIITKRDNNTITVIFYDATTSSYIGVDTVGTIPVATWAHLAITKDSSTSSAGINIYINGVLQNTVDRSSGVYTAMANTISPLILGKAGWFDSIYYGGFMEELSFFSVEFDQTDIDELYNSGLPTNLNGHNKAANLRVWNRFGDGDTWTGSNWQFLDNSTNNNTFTSVNMEESDRRTDIPL